MGVAADRPPTLPGPRGPVTEALIERLPCEPPQALPRRARDSGWSEDVQLALYLCYELHYRGCHGVDPDWEWDPGLLELRRDLESGFLDAVREALGEVPDLDRQFAALLVEPAAGAGPSHFLLEEGRRWQAREYLVHRSLYHLKEADPQVWAVPRLHGAAQAGLLAVAFDEYGDGHPERVHSRLFAEMMTDLGPDSGYGRYLEAVPSPALAAVNLISLFGLHRAHRGALTGQFAGMEIASSPGADRLARALERLGASSAGTRFYREHVEADAVHEQLVRREVVQSLLDEEPGIEPDIAFGLAASALVEDRLADQLASCWRAGRSSLRTPLPDAPSAGG